VFHRASCEHIPTTPNHILPRQRIPICWGTRETERPSQATKPAEPILSQTTAIDGRSEAHIVTRIEASELAFATSSMKKFSLKPGKFL
jgi:hypothetical protein